MLNLPKMTQLMYLSAFTDPKSGERCCFFGMNEEKSNKLLLTLETAQCQYRNLLRLKFSLEYWVPNVNVIVIA